MNCKYSLLPVVYFSFGALVTSIGNLAFAQESDSTLIHACVVPSSGTIHIIGPNDSCNKNEIPLSWSTGSSNSMGNHHKELNFSLAPGQQQTVPLPKTDTPVRVEVSISKVVFRYSDGHLEIPPPFIVGRVFSLDSDTRLISRAGDQVNYFTGSGPLKVFVLGYGERVNAVGEPEKIVIGSLIESQSYVELISDVLEYSVQMWY